MVIESKSKEGRRNLYFSSLIWICLHGPFDPFILFAQELLGTMHDTAVPHHRRHLDTLVALLHDGLQERRFLTSTGPHDPWPGRGFPVGLLALHLCAEADDVAARLECPGNLIKDELRLRSF